MSFFSIDHLFRTGCPLGIMVDFIKANSNCKEREASENNKMALWLEYPKSTFTL